MTGRTAQGYTHPEACMLLLGAMRSGSTDLVDSFLGEMTPGEAQSLLPAVLALFSHILGLIDPADLDRWTQRAVRHYLPAP